MEILGASEPRGEGPVLFPSCTQRVELTSALQMTPPGTGHGFLRTSHRPPLRTLVMLLRSREACAMFCSTAGRGQPTSRRTSASTRRRAGRARPAARPGARPPRVMQSVRRTDLAIDFSTMRNLHDGDRLVRVVNLVQGAVVALSDTVALAASQLLAARWPRIGG